MWRSELKLADCRETQSWPKPEVEIGANTIQSSLFYFFHHGVHSNQSPAAASEMHRVDASPRVAECQRDPNRKVQPIVQPFRQNGSDREGRPQKGRTDDLKAGTVWRLTAKKQSANQSEVFRNGYVEFERASQYGRSGPEF